MTPEEISESLTAPYRTLSKFGYDLPVGLVLVWLSSGPGRQLEFDMDADEACDGFVYWWLQGGKVESPGLREVLERYLMQSLHLQHLPEPGQSRKLTATPLIRLIWRNRPDLAAVFDIKTPKDVARLWRWWLHQGHKELFDGVAWFRTAELDALHSCDLCGFDGTTLVEHTALVRLVREADPELKRDYDLGSLRNRTKLWDHFLKVEARNFGLSKHGLPRIIPSTSPRSGILQALGDQNALLYSVRPDLQRNFNLRTDKGLSSFIYWCLTTGAASYPDLARDIVRPIVEALHLQHLPKAGKSQKLKITPLMQIVRGQRKDLAAVFDVRTPEGVASLWHWWLFHGHQELFGGAGWFKAEELGALQACHPNGFNGTTSAESPGSVTHQAVTSDGGEKVGRSKKRARNKIGLIGYPQGVLGLGEDIRLLQASLQKVGIHPEVIRAPWKLTASESATHSAISASQAEFECDVMFYVIPAFDTVTLLSRMGSKAFAARRKIGFWQWELEILPEQAKLATNLVDEIWCHSEHSAQAFRAATQKPVIRVPLPVFVPKPKRVPRSVFGLPKEAFVVFTAFDGSSHITRKNPLASILAFQAAFPADGSTKACLVVKAMNTRNDSLWRECLRKSAIDRRIMIFDAVWERAAFYECLRNCDAVISLHRAEGFGRLMAESMALGIPVIATKYSGNLDFMTEENSWLVDGDLIPVLAGDYPFYKNQVWCEPRVAKAAKMLRQCAGNASMRNARSALAQSDITERYSLAFCGKAYSKLLGAD